MCLSQGLNEKLCPVSFSALVTDSPPSPPCTPILFLLSPILLSLSPPLPPAFFPVPLPAQGGCHYRAVDSAALGVSSLLCVTHSLIKHANRIYRPRFNHRSPCRHYVVSDILLWVFLNLIIWLWHFWTSSPNLRCIKVDTLLIECCKEVTICCIKRGWLPLNLHTPKSREFVLVTKVCLDLR